MRFETQVGASVVGCSAREDAAQSGLQENSEGGKAAIAAPVQVILVQNDRLQVDNCHDCSRAKMSQIAREQL
jgi:hypothetical protein